MENTMKPIRVPIQLPHKYYGIVWFWSLLVVWSLPAYGMIALNPPERVLIAFMIVWVLVLFATSFMPLFYDLVFFPEGVFHPA